MRLAIWARVARRFLLAADPFFSVKMHINELVINEIALAVYPDAKNRVEAQNATAIAMVHSNVHGKINDLARDIVDEINKQKKISKNSPLLSNV